MRTSPLLLGATLVFWGWQTGYFIPGGILAALFESAYLIKGRWEFSDEDYNRVWNFCMLLLLASAVYAFTANNGPGDVRGFFEHPSFFTQRNVGNTTSRAAAAWLRWLPMILALPAAAQVFGARQGVSLEALSLILRRRRKKARRLGEPLPASRTIDISYFYFALCLFSASIHFGEDNSFFWGAGALVGWALWPRRVRRFRLATWAAAFAMAVALAYVGQRGVGQLQRYVENFNPQWLADWTRRRVDPAQNKTQLGQIGRIKTSAAIVIRLEAKDGAPPPLLRETSYRTYKSQVWSSDVPESSFDEVKETSFGSSIYALVPQKTNTVTVSIACYLDDRRALLPLPSGTGRLEHLWAISVHKSPLGGVLVEGPGLVVFDACYGPGAGLDASANYNLDEDLAPSPKETAALDQVISELQLRGKSQEVAMRTLSGFFRDKFTYSLWQEFGKAGSANETPLGRFLLRTHRGHCEYFATATVLLLRELGFPARYAVGYAVHEGTGGKYVVRQRDAHAWCQVWDPAEGLWHDFDTTPPSWTEVEGRRASPLQFLSDVWSRIVFEISKIRWGQSELRQYLMWTMAPILGLLLYQIIFRRRRRRQPEAHPPAILWPGLDSEFYQLEQKLIARGFARPCGEPLSEWLRRAAADPALADLRESFEQLLHLHYRYRFDPQGLSKSDRDQLRREARLCLDGIERPKGIPREEVSLTAS
jgi:hypothetical protein